MTRKTDLVHAAMLGAVLALFVVLIITNTFGVGQPEALVLMAAAIGIGVNWRRTHTR